MAVAHAAHGVCAQRRAATRGAVEDDSTISVELIPVVWAGGVDEELQHPTRGRDGIGYPTLASEFCLLTDVDY